MAEHVFLTWLTKERVLVEVVFFFHLLLRAVRNKLVIAN